MNTTPAQWLEARFDTLASILDPGVDHMPILGFKSVMDAGEAMHVYEADYADQGRWWL